MITLLTQWALIGSVRTNFCIENLDVLYRMWPMKFLQLLHNIVYNFCVYHSRLLADVR
jgi:hypothetical protein